MYSTIQYKIQEAVWTTVLSNIQDSNVHYKTILYKPQDSSVYYRTAYIKQNLNWTVYTVQYGIYLIDTSKVAPPQFSTEYKLEKLWATKGDILRRSWVRTLVASRDWWASLNNNIYTSKTIIMWDWWYNIETS